jgi:hypothetical protein
MQKQGLRFFSPAPIILDVVEGMCTSVGLRLRYRAVRMIWRKALILWLWHKKANRAHLKEFVYADLNSVRSTMQEWGKKILYTLTHCCIVKEEVGMDVYPAPNPAFCLYPFNTKSPSFAPSGTRGTYYCYHRYVTSAHTDIL